MPVNEELDRAPTTPSLERARSFFGRNSASNGNNPGENEDVEESEEEKGRPTRWSLGVMNDPNTHEVPGMTVGFGE